MNTDLRGAHSRGRRSVLLLLALVTLGLAVSPVAALALRSGIPAPLELMRSSESVFAGTVVSSIPARQHGSIFTTVRFSRLNFIKGPPTDTLQLVLEGGRVGPDGVIVDYQPEFEAGGRYIVFALLKPRRVGLPVIECFRVRGWDEEQEKQAIPLCDYENGAPRLTEAEFLTAIAAACADSLKTR